MNKFNLLACFLSLFIIISETVIAQNTSEKLIDSLKHALRNAKPDTNKVNLLNQLSSQFSQRSAHDSAYFYAQSALELAKSKNFKRGIATAYRYCGNYFYSKSDTANAVNLYQEALSISRQIGDVKGMIYNLQNFGNLYADNYNKAVNYYQQAL